METTSSRYILDYEMEALRRLARYGLSYKRYLVLAWISLLGANVLALAVPWLIGDAIDSVLADGNRGVLFCWPGSSSF